MSLGTVVRPTTPARVGTAVAFTFSTQGCAGKLAHTPLQGREMKKVIPGAGVTLPIFHRPTTSE